MSATFSANALAGIERLMRRPQRIMLAPDHVSLLGVRQYYSLVPGELVSPCCNFLVPWSYARVIPPCCSLALEMLATPLCFCRIL